MMRKKTTYTHITPIPSFIPRQLAIDILHSHVEVIELNPLVTGVKPVKAPRDAPSDEFYATWYEISQRIQYIPGIGKLGSGAIKFKGCFHDMPWGLQTHIYAPAGVDMRNKWQICGNQPDEPVQTTELGLGAPPEGLYLREDIEIKCNLTMAGFVRKENKAASKVFVERLIKKAELLDAGVLHGMMEKGKLKTINPADRSSRNPGSPGPSPQYANLQPYNLPMSPGRSPTQRHHSSQQQFICPEQNNAVMELPGDYHHPQPSSGHLHPDRRLSHASDGSASPNMPDARWSQASNEYQSSMSSRPSSYAPSDNLRSPGLDQKAFTTELPTMEETREEHSDRLDRESQQSAHQLKYNYNPQDYAPQAHYAVPPQYSPHNPQGRQ
ncbi:uncharacterized protein M421DRAFT_243805 [Didymella exigua CBS 183.55]|uniref:DUF7053 domain-containing protein n=1 Tax=Didymella exigua CBS 183.55 TaxID=1150837 RepID=A0A6A5RVQ3_9PLEO|nr:uncharacterized protein M421DRAFT_243805 [Didymella exigua CBS 183.55]KAF1932541.1 hypothetical protein M421DRAFT_243805 [Didymella exigua CBS 183.55]